MVLSEAVTGMVFLATSATFVCEEQSLRQRYVSVPKCLDDGFEVASAWILTEVWKRSNTSQEPEGKGCINQTLPNKAAASLQCAPGVVQHWKNLQLKRTDRNTQEEHTYRHCLRKQMIQLESSKDLHTQCRIRSIHGFVRTYNRHDVARYEKSFNSIKWQCNFKAEVSKKVWVFQTNLKRTGCPYTGSLLAD